MNGAEIVIGDQKVKVTKVGSVRLRTARVILNGHEIQAIEQNRDKPSHWGKLARKGHQVVQLFDGW